MEKKTFDVLALGELLIDFTDNGLSAQGNPVFEANPGGAPCNVLAMLRKLGRECAFCGKVGDDLFGRQLRDTVRSLGIDTRALVLDKVYPTTLAFVKNSPDGDREFSFYRRSCADVQLTAEELDEMPDAKCFHFGSLSLTEEPVRGATRQAVSAAKQKGLLVSFDPNFRPPLWSSEARAREQIKWGLSQCDLAKIADNEVEFLTGETDLVKGAAILRERFPDLRLLCVTAGADGSYAYWQDVSVFQPAFRLGGTVETTGAGDTFCACMIDRVLSHGLDALSEAQLTEMLRFANAAAYLVTTKKGAIRSMPEREQIEQVLCR